MSKLANEKSEEERQERRGECETKFDHQYKLCVHVFVLAKREFKLHVKFHSAIKSFFLSISTTYCISNGFSFQFVCARFFYLLSLSVLISLVCLVFSRRNQFSLCVQFHSHVKTNIKIKKRKMRVKRKHTHTHAHRAKERDLYRHVPRSGPTIDRIALNHCQCQ